MPGGFKQVCLDTAKSILAAIDWAEQTYRIKIDVPKEILDWIGPVNKKK